MSSFGDRLRAARSAAGLTQDQLGFEVGVTNSAVSNWENGRDVPSFSLLPKIRAAVHRSLDELICDIGPPHTTHARNIRGVLEPEMPYADKVEIQRAANPNELALLIRFRALKPGRRAALLELLKPGD